MGYLKTSVIITLVEVRMTPVLYNHITHPITECGMPQGGRSLVLSAVHHSSSRVIWVLNAGHPLSVFPPAWSQFDLEKILFLRISDVIKEAKALFLEPCFNTIVLDSFRNLREEDLAFIGMQARRFKFQTILIRDFFLTSKQGNIWAKSRFNILFDAKKDIFQIQTVRGIPSKKIAVRAYT